MLQQKLALTKLKVESGSIFVVMHQLPVKGLPINYIHMHSPCRIIPCF